MGLKEMCSGSCRRLCRTISGSERQDTSPVRISLRGRKKIMARPYRKILKIYEEAGLSADKSFTEPEDHVATE